MKSRPQNPEFRINPENSSMEKKYFHNHELIQIYVALICKAQLLKTTKF